MTDLNVLFYTVYGMTILSLPTEAYLMAEAGLRNGHDPEILVLEIGEKFLN